MNININFHNSTKIIYTRLSTPVSTYNTQYPKITFVQLISTPTPGMKECIIQSSFPHRRATRPHKCQDFEIRSRLTSPSACCASAYFDVVVIIFQLSFLSLFFLFWYRVFSLSLFLPWKLEVFLHVLHSPYICHTQTHLRYNIASIKIKLQHKREVNTNRKEIFRK